LDYRILQDLALEEGGKIVYLILDGLGGLRMEGWEGTELQVARTPNLNRMASQSVCGLLDPIWPGITPGSGPAHFAIFGYDPLQFEVGRGVLAALGIGFQLTERDVAARINFCTLDQEGKVADRRAGRIPTEENRRLCAKLRESLNLGTEFFIEPVKEHRAVLVLRGEGLGGDLADTDPQKEGSPPLEPRSLSPESKRTAELVEDFIRQAKEILADEPKANMLILRGFAKYNPFPTMEERYKLHSLAIANYPMYRGLARLVGMDVWPDVGDLKDEFRLLAQNFSQYDFFYLHIKKTDSFGEDGNFAAKVKVIEEVDSLLPQVLELGPEVIVVTADHSTPSKLKSHSWHPIPVLLFSPNCRVDEVERFDEISCIKGGLGRLPAVALITLALAHARRLKKYGA